MNVRLHHFRLPIVPAEYSNPKGLLCDTQHQLVDFRFVVDSGSGPLVDDRF
jgi:hypothetical protein